jgi:hypothetical protein
LSKCSKWRLSKNRGLVADGWNQPFEIATPDWVSKFANQTHSGVCLHVRKVLTQSGVAIFRK